MTEKIKQVTGLSFGQILSVLGLTGGLLAVWIRVEVAIAVLQERMNVNESNIKELLIDNKAEHKAISEKLDKIMFEDVYKNR